MATKPLGPIRYTAPPQGGADYRATSAAIEGISGLAQNLYTGKVLDEGTEAVDEAVKGAISSAAQDPLDVANIQPAASLTPDDFALQFNAIRNRINNTSGSVKQAAILAGKKAIQDQITAHPAFRDKLVREFNAYMSSSPELQNAAMMDADQTKDTAAQDYIDRVTTHSYSKWSEGGLGIPAGYAIGTPEWAKLYQDQSRRRAEHDARVEELSILTVKGGLSGPRALALSMEQVYSDSGDVQGLFTDLTNILEPLAGNRVDGRLKPADEEAWALQKDDLLRDIDMAILQVGNKVNEIWTNNPVALRDSESYNRSQTLINNVQADLMVVRNALKEDNFDIVETMKRWSYIRGHRLIGEGLLRNIVDVETAANGLFSKAEGGITNAFKALQVETEVPIADAMRDLFSRVQNSTGDGATTSADSPEDYVDKKKQAEANVRTDKAESQKVKVRTAKEAADNLNMHLSTMNGELSYESASEGLATLGSQWKALSEAKTFIFDGGDQARIRTTAAHPQVERLALAAVKHNLPGLALESEQFETYWRSTSDAKDLDSFEAWHTELAELAQDTVPSVPYITNIMEVVRPLEFQQIQNDGEIHLVVNEKMIEAAIREDLKRRGITEASLPSETAIAVGFAKKQAAAVSAEATKFLRVRSTRNIMANRLKKPDYLDAFFDPITGLDKIFTLDENVVSK